jgi:hypothetical protein
MYPKVSGLSHNEINNKNNNKHTLRINKKGYGDKSHQTDSQNSDTTSPSSRELYHLQFSLQVASPETFGYTLVNLCSDHRGYSHQQKFKFGSPESSVVKSEVFLLATFLTTQAASSAEVKSAWSYTSNLPIHFHGHRRAAVYVHLLVYLTTVYQMKSM